MFTDSRLLPAAGAFPTPGKDVSGTPWQEHMRSGEIALFYFDARTGQSLTAKGSVPQTPIQEYCVAYRSLYMARLVARSRVLRNPGMTTVLYDKRGKWLATISRAGESRRNPGLGFARVLIQFPLMALYGTLTILAISAISERYFHFALFYPEHLSAQEWNGLITAGLLLAIPVWMFFQRARLKAVIHLTRSSRQPVGSPGRENFYKQLARNNKSSLLIPIDITFETTAIEWPSQEKHDRWAEVLRREGFELHGAYLIPEVGSQTEIWFNTTEDFVAEIINHQKVKMFLSVLTRYEDWSSLSVSNRRPSPVDPHPTKRSICLGLEATVEEVMEKARRERPDHPRRKAVRENILPDYATSWRQRVEWRRARGTTAEEYKRVDQRKAAARAKGESWL
jgi:hypothetical protein